MHRKKCADKNPYPFFLQYNKSAYWDEFYNKCIIPSIRTLPGSSTTYRSNTMNQNHVALFGDDWHDITARLKQTCTHATTDGDSVLFDCTLFFILTRFGMHIDVTDKTKNIDVPAQLLHNTLPHNAKSTLIHIAQEYLQPSCTLSWRTDSFHHLQTATKYANMASHSTSNVTMTEMPKTATEATKLNFGQTTTVRYAQFYSTSFRAIQNMDLFEVGRITALTALDSRQIKHQKHNSPQYRTRLKHITNHDDYNNLTEALKDNTDKPARVELVLDFNTDVTNITNAVTNATDCDLSEMFGIDQHNALLALNTEQLNGYLRNTINTLYDPLRDCIDRLERDYKPTLTTIATTRVVERLLHYICAGDTRTLTPITQTLGRTAARRRNDRLTLLGTHTYVNEHDRLTVRPHQQVLDSNDNCATMERLNWFMTETQTALDNNTLLITLPTLLLTAYRTDTYMWARPRSARMTGIRPEDVTTARIHPPHQPSSTITIRQFVENVFTDRHLHTRHMHTAPRLTNRT